MERQIQVQEIITFFTGVEGIESTIITRLPGMYIDGEVG